MKPVLMAVVASCVLIGAYVAAGGASYAPDRPRDPCESQQWSEPSGIDELAQQLALSGLDGAACDLGVTREELARALATDEARERFQEEHEIGSAELEDAVRAGLMRMIDDAEDAGELSSLVAVGLRGLVRVVPAEEAFELLLDARPLIEQGFEDGDEDSRFGLGDLFDELGDG